MKEKKFGNLWKAGKKWKGGKYLRKILEKRKLNIEEGKFCLKNLREKGKRKEKRKKRWKDENILLKNHECEKILNEKEGKVLVGKSERNELKKIK